MKNKQNQKTIDDYIDNNELNARIYQILLNFQDNQTYCRNKLKKTPLEIFDQVYKICEELEHEKHPEQAVLEIWDGLRPQFLLCETSIIFSCIYVILLFSEMKNSNMRFFLTRIKQKIDENYFQEFEPLIREELTRITEATDSFDLLKIEADKICDLNKRELLYIDVFMHYKQGNILQKISNEIDFIERVKILSAPEKQDYEMIDPTGKDSADAVACIKIRSAVILSLLKKMQLGKAHNDLTKISKLVAFLTGKSDKQIYKAMQEGIYFSDFHTKDIEKANKILSELKTSISIEINERY